MRSIAAVVIQGSSKSWSGGKDMCMMDVQGKPAIAKTIEVWKSYLPNVPIYVAAPEFDKGNLNFLGDFFSDIKINYSHNASPFHRIVEIANKFTSDDLLIRADATHPIVLKRHLDEAMRVFEDQAIDFLKFPDDYPAQFGFELIKISAIKSLQKIVDNSDFDPALLVHSKFAYKLYPEQFNCVYLNPTLPTNEELNYSRSLMKCLYDVPRTEIGSSYISHGDQLRFHYEKAIAWLPKAGVYLDIACGSGFGSKLISESAAKVIGCDIDNEILRFAKNNVGDFADKVSFEFGDITNLHFDDETFDAVLSMETIEHVEPQKMLNEVYRVLKPGGIMVLSTPQNSIGHIPINSAHHVEFSLIEIVNLVKIRFQIKELIGIKAGRVHFVGDYTGQNTMIIAQRV